MPKKGKIKDKWKLKKWYSVITPEYFGGLEIGSTPADDSSKLIGRVMETTLYQITNDFSHQYMKLYFQIVSIKDSQAETIFKGHEYGREFLRSLIRRRCSKIDGIVDVTTKDGYRLRVYVLVITLSKISRSQETAIRKIIGQIATEKASNLTLGELAQEMVLGKLASDVYNEAKKISPLRHVGVRKSKLLTPLEEVIQRLNAQAQQAQEVQVQAQQSS